MSVRLSKDAIMAEDRLAADLAETHERGHLAAHRRLFPDGSSRSPFIWHQLGPTQQEGWRDVARRARELAKEGLLR